MTNLSIVGTGNQQSPFDSIRRFDGQGNEFWVARDLMPLLGYTTWQKFSDAIDRASFACENSGNVITEHFLPESVKSHGRPKEDYRLSRYACYLTAMNGDPRKPEIAAAQSYFAAKSREAEVVIPAQSDRIRELELALALAQAEAQKFLAEKAVLDTRHLIVSTCPEPVQQKIFGFQVIKEVEYRDRIIKDNEVINDGGTITKTELCHRYGILTRNGKPDYKRLNQHLEAVGIAKLSEAWEMSTIIQENNQLRRDYLAMLDDRMMNAERQMYIGE